MGLDMYLYRKTFIWTNHKIGKRDLHDLKLPEKYKHVDPAKISGITEQVGYWRKANHIHAWFVKNVQNGEDDCGSYDVSEEQLLQLLADCKRVKENANVAPELLPTQSGFFFGGTDYDEYYMQEIDDTIEIIDWLVTQRESENYLGDIQYHSSW